MSVALRTFRPVLLAALAGFFAWLGLTNPDMAATTGASLAGVAALLVWFDVRMLDGALSRLGREIGLEDATSRGRVREAFGLGTVGFVVAPLFSTVTCVILAFGALSIATDGLMGVAIAVSVWAGVALRGLLGVTAIIWSAATATPRARAALSAALRAAFGFS